MSNSEPVEIRKPVRLLTGEDLEMKATVLDYQTETHSGTLAVIEHHVFPHRTILRMSGPYREIFVHPDSIITLALP